MLILIYLSVIYLITVKGESIVFDLSDYEINNKTTQTFEKFVNLTETTNRISIDNKPPNTFCTVQIHTFFVNVTLSYSQNLTIGSFINGSNIGLIITNETQLFLQTPNNVTVLLIIIIYRDYAPIPGGCNLSFDIPVAPYQRTYYTDEIIVVESQAAIAPGTTCEKNNVKVDLYHMYLNENEHDEDTYFSSIRKMSTVDRIKENGRKINKVDGFFTYKKLYSSYRGIGRVFAIIATFNNHSSAYIPTVSYGCDIKNYSEDCIGPATIHWKVMLPLLLIFGLFICFFGHKFFGVTVYLNGICFGIFFGFILVTLTLDSNISFAGKSTISIIIGIIYASLWLLLWWLCGIPLLSISITFFLTGYLIASVIFYSGVADYRLFNSDLNFWFMQICIIIFIMILCVALTKLGHITACSVLGSYACITAFNYYVGGNLQYIIINSYRRIVVKNFNMATIDPPFQIYDLVQTIVWCIMTAYGWYYQLKGQRGRAPFPPHTTTTTERTPLLQERYRRSPVSFPNLKIISFLQQVIRRRNNTLP